MGWGDAGLLPDRCARFVLLDSSKLSARLLRTCSTVRSVQGRLLTLLVKLQGFRSRRSSTCTTHSSQSAPSTAVYKWQRDNLPGYWRRKHKQTVSYSSHYDTYSTESVYSTLFRFQKTVFFPFSTGDFKRQDIIETPTSVVNCTTN